MSSDSVAQIASSQNAGGSLRRNALGLWGAMILGVVIMAPLRLAGLSEEHGWLKLGEQAPLSVGERLLVLPNHACAVVNNFDKMTVVRDGEPVGEWDIAARGRVT
jgi:D-serine deaminase-like pyridoxal phosphate-dependent protein